MHNVRRIALVATAALLAACSDDDSTGPSNDRRVAVFAAGTYVDFDSTDYGSEASNMYLAAKDAGFPTIFFDRIADTTIARVTSQSDVIVFPENSVGAYYVMTPAARTSLKTFVQDGGTVILTYDNHALLDSLTGATTGYAYPDSDFVRVQTNAASGTTFAGGPQRLPYADDTEGVLVSSLPANSKAIYTGAAGAGTAAWVAAVTVGQGQVVYLAWDWYASAPLGAQDGGWNDVFARAIRY